MDITGSVNGLFNIVKYVDGLSSPISTYNDSLCAVRRTSNSRGSLLTYRPSDVIPQFTQFTPNSGYVILAKNDFTLPRDIFGAINVTPDPNILSLISFNNWSNSFNLAGTGSKYFYPTINSSIYGPFPIAGGSYVPDYLYPDYSNGLYVGYINRPECPLSGWFVNYDLTTPLLYNSAANASPTNIPSSGWFKAVECPPTDTIVNNISCFKLSIVPYLFNRINPNAYLSLTSSDYTFDGNILELYKNNNSSFNAITALDLIQFDGTRETKVKMDLTNFSNLAYINNFISMTNLTDFSLPINDKLEFFSSATFPKLTSFRYKPNHIYPRLQQAWVSNVNVSQLNPPLSESSNFYDNLITSVYSAISSEQLSAWTLGYPLANLPSYSNTNSGAAMGRSSSSDDTFLKLIATNYFGIPFELDSYFPIQYLPTGTYYPHTLGNTLVLQAPVSAQGGTLVRFNALSGIYTKTGDIKDNRDVFRNNDNYFVLFDEPQQRWTVVGPLSTSSTVWLSTQETIGDYGNIPKRGWGGPAYRRLTSQPWSVDTCVYSTQTLVYSATRVINGRYGYDPYQGFNNDSFWKDLDFSGIGYNAAASDPEWNGKMILVSPVHFVNTAHFPGVMSEGSLWKFVHKDGSVSTRSVLSSIDIGLTDVRIGILNNPVSAACYSIGNFTNFNKSISAKSDYARVLLGPTATGEVSQGIRLNASGLPAINSAPSTYFKFSSLPKSRWYSSSSLVIGESSSGMWMRQRNNQLSLFGLIKYSNFASEVEMSSVYNSLFNAATSLCNTFYGNPLTYTLTATNFTE